MWIVETAQRHAADMSRRRSLVFLAEFSFVLLQLNISKKSDRNDGQMPARHTVPAFFRGYSFDLQKTNPDQIPVFTD
jgi:hypothetical protein